MEVKISDVPLFVYKRYQRNVKRSEELRCEILKGLEAGESAEELLLKAAETIEMLTNDKGFYEGVSRKLEKRKEQQSETEET